MYHDLSLEQARQTIDTEQVFEAWRLAMAEQSERFQGTMNWRPVSGTDYLYRIKRKSAKSLGRRSAETEAIEAAFLAGKARIEESLAGLAARLDAFARVNVALGLARVPRTAARIIRALERGKLVGRAVLIAGTHALYAYERLAAVQVDGGFTATRDLDLLFDSRRSLKLIAPEISREGVIGVLRRLDQSFRPTAPGSFRAVNDEGFMVYLIRPSPKDRMRSEGPSRIGDVDDLTAVEIEGLSALVQVPHVEATAIDEGGYPLRLACPDPRAFALHKLWISRRADRDPTKRQRDEAQARLVAELATTRLRLRFDDVRALSALPARIRDLAPELAAASTPPPGPPRLEPDW